MIISKVFGGLGNQMFQYAAGRALSVRLNVSMQVDTRSLRSEGASHNGYELASVFRIDCDQATDTTVRRVLGWRSTRKVQRVLRKLKINSGQYVHEPHFHHWPDFDQLTAPCYLDGYWQSYRYFCGHAKRVADDFEFRQPLQSENLRICQMIDSQPQSVAIHVRRGDYVSNRSAANHHGTCGVAYYRAALEYLVARLPQPIQCYVFSDDIPWAVANLPLPATTVFVGHNRGADSHFDMQLMSRCRHNVLANSSFSWWAAWLNRNPSKIVVGPKRWFLAKYDTSSLTPPDWIRIS